MRQKWYFWLWIRFEIEKKLRDAKRREQRVKRKTVLREVSASERSLDRRKNVENKALGKKKSALEDLRAKRERKQGLYVCMCISNS